MALAALIVAVIALRAYLPVWVTRAINQQLAELGGYHGHVRDVDLALWRGAYRINGLVIRQTDAGDEQVPLVSAPRIDLAVSWAALFKGAVAAEVEFQSPQVNFVHAPSSDQDQAGQGVDWREQLQALLPIRLNAVRVYEGSVHFRNFEADPEVDVYLTDLAATVTNLSNADRRDGIQVANLDATARVLDGAPLELAMQFDPLGEMAAFELDLRVRDAALVRLDDLLRAYAGIDVEKGQADLVVELAARDRVLDGYGKLLLRDLDVVSWTQDVERDDDNPVLLGWEGVLTGVLTLLTNQQEDQFALRAPITGKIDAPRGRALAAVISIVRNAFVEALKADFESADEEAPFPESDRQPAQDGPRERHGPPGRRPG